MLLFLRCVGRSIREKGLKVLAGLVPMGEQIYEIAECAIQHYRNECREAALREDVELLVHASAVQVRIEAQQIAAEVLAGRPVEEVVRLEQYLVQVPAVARQSFKRPEDQIGTTVPAGVNLLDPLQMGNLLPRRLPRFQAGESVPHAPQWKFVELLGTGGFGEVWLAHNPFLDQKRALKFCLDTTVRERLLRYEGEIVRQVMQASPGVREDQHGIVPLLDAYLEGDTPWLAYEYVNGGDLATIVRKQAELSPVRRGERSLQFLIALAGVIGRLHILSQPIIHRDLKPANILLKRFDKQLLLRVTDFGISHVEADRGLRQATISTPQMSLGETYRGAHTPIYASPQQKRGSKPDVRDDVHALGIIGWQLLLGDLGAERPAGKWRRRLADTELSDGILDLLESCWDDDPNERPTNAAVLAQQLRQLVQSSGSTPANSKSEQATEPRVEKTTPPPWVAPSSTSKPTPQQYTNRLGMQFVRVPKGTFWMGGHGGKRGEKQVAVEYEYYMGKFPVTQSEWYKVMGRNPSWFQKTGHKRGEAEVASIGDEELQQHPVETINWFACLEYICELNDMVSESGWIYRLPTEIEWEYACRGAMSSRHDCSWSYYFDQPTNELTQDRANCRGVWPGLGRTSRVGAYPANSLGIHDLHGNVCEWCHDLIGDNGQAISERERVDCISMAKRIGSAGGMKAVLRGGSWHDSHLDCNAAFRYLNDPTCVGRNFGAGGIRLVRVPA